MTLKPPTPEEVETVARAIADQMVDKHRQHWSLYASEAMKAIISGRAYDELKAKTEGQ